jgi:nicotinamide riboside kinase
VEVNLSEPPAVRERRRGVLRVCVLGAASTGKSTLAAFHEMYLGERNAELEALVEPQRYALYLLCDVETPFHRDRLGLRR